MKFFPFGKLLKSSSYIGIDIGTTTIKMAELRHSGRGTVTLVNYGILETSGYLDRLNSALQTSNLKLLDTDIIQFLKILVSKVRPKTQRVMASLPAFSAFTTLLELPVMSDHEIGQSIKFQAKNYVPLPISSVTIDWIKVGEKVEPDGTKKQQVFLISVPNELIEAYTNIFKQSGLQLEALEIESMSIARALTNKNEKPTLVIDIGGRSTAISVGYRGELKFSGQTDFASGSLTQSLATGLNISSRRAEDLKKQAMLIGVGGQRELSTIMLPIVDVIINEATRVKNGFEGGYKQTIASVVLAGSGANMHGLADYISQQMKLPVTTANPFGFINYAPQMEGLKKSLGPTLSVAIGAALKNFALS
jgi:type IV pilus assembly protein PilM